MKIHLIADVETVSTPQVSIIDLHHSGWPARILVRWGRLDLTMSVDEAEELATSMLERCSAARRPQ